MRVGQPPLPHLMPTAQGHERKGGDQAPADVFEALLQTFTAAGKAALLQDISRSSADPTAASPKPIAQDSPYAVSLQPEPACAIHAEPLFPKIGSHSRSFAGARLLVETSTDLSRGQPRKLQGDRWTADPSDHKITRAIEAVRRLLQEIHGNVSTAAASDSEASPSSAVPLGLPPTVPDLMAVEAGGKNGVTSDLPVATTGSPVARAEQAVPESFPGLARPAAQPSVSRRASCEVEEATEDTSPNAPGARQAKARPQMQQSRLAIRLSAAEDGLTISIRLPRLEDRERGELEARLASLLRAFGYDRHELVVHELANTGES